MQQLIPVKAAGGVVYCNKENQIFLLVILRKQVWDLPKGKVEPDETLEQAAIREVEEETGCLGTVITHNLGKTLHEYEQEEDRYQKTTWWFGMQCNVAHLEPQIEEDIQSVRWMTPGEALEHLYYDNLKEVVSRFCSEMNIDN